MGLQQFQRENDQIRPSARWNWKLYPGFKAFRGDHREIAPPKKKFVELWVSSLAEPGLLPTVGEIKDAMTLGTSSPCAISDLPAFSAHPCPILGPSSSMLSGPLVAARRRPDCRTPPPLCGMPLGHTYRSTSSRLGTCSAVVDGASSELAGRGQLLTGLEESDTGKPLGGRQDGEEFLFSFGALLSTSVFSRRGVDPTAGGRRSFVACTAPGSTVPASFFRRILDRPRSFRATYDDFLPHPQNVGTRVVRLMHGQRAHVSPPHSYHPVSETQEFHAGDSGITSSWIIIGSWRYCLSWED